MSGSKHMMRMHAMFLQTLSEASPAAEVSTVKLGSKRANGKRRQVRKDGRRLKKNNSAEAQQAEEKRKAAASCGQACACCQKAAAACSAAACKECCKKGGAACKRHGTGATEALEAWYTNT